MAGFFGQNIDNQLYFIYGLVALVVILIIVIVVLDRKETKRRKQNEKLLSNTLNFKPITDDSYIDKNIDDIEVVDLKRDEEEKIPEIPDVVPQQEQLHLEFEEDTTLDDDEYIEDELDKTQAQIRVEEITSALEKAVAEEKQEQQDKYMAFEEEQEKNAIISYKELKKSYDKLYEENEKIQYVDDDSIPISVNELYEYNRPKEVNQEPVVKTQVVEEKVEIKQEEPKKVKLEDFNENKQTFKRSPYISPVYGIQKPVEITSDSEVTDANKFLNDLKELRDNLD